jgi:uncharacterized protein YggT (Ycf19 family)
VLGLLLSVLFAFAFWLVAIWAALGALLALAFLYFLARNWLDEQAERAAMRDLAPISLPPARPFDQCDPLERQFALSCAPDPQRRVR